MNAGVSINLRIQVLYVFPINLDQSQLPAEKWIVKSEL